MTMLYYTTRLNYKNTRQLTVYPRDYYFLLGHMHGLTSVKSNQCSRVNEHPVISQAIVYSRCVSRRRTLFFDRRFLASPTNNGIIGSASLTMHAADNGL